MPATPARGRALAAAALVALASAAALALAWIPALAEAGDGPVQFSLVRVEAGPHYLTSLAAGRVEATLVVEIAGPSVIARLARAIEVDVAIEEVPMGRLVADRASPLLGSPATFDVTLSADLAEGSEAALRLSQALEKHPGRASVETRGHIFLAFGASRPFDASGFAPVTTDPARAASHVDPIPFSLDGATP